MPGYEIDKTFTTHPSTSRNRPYPVSKLLTSLSFRQEEHAENVLKRMQDYMEGRKFCDVILVAGTDGKRVSAHRLILAATSEYFANLFSTKEHLNNMEFEENESEMEEELNTKSLQEDSDRDNEIEEVIIVGLMRRKGSEEDEEFVTMKGRLHLKSKHEDSSKCYFTGVLNRGSRLEEEEVEEVKCSKNFYNQECKKLEEQELPHCLELGPGQYFRKYPEIVSQEINSRVVKSIDALCLEAKVDKNEAAKSTTDAIRASQNTSSAESYFFTEPPQKKELLDPIVTKQAPVSNADSLLVKALKSSLKKNEEKNVDSLTSSADSLEKSKNKKEVRISEDCKKRQVSEKVDPKFCYGKDRMKGGGGNDPETTTDSDKIGSILPCSSAFSNSTRVQKQEIQKQKQLRTISHGAEFDLKQNDKPLRLSLRYESKDKEILLTGTLRSKDETETNKYKLRRIGGEVLKQQFEKNKTLTVREFLSKSNEQETLSASRALHTETKLEGALKENSDFRFVNQNGVKNSARYAQVQAEKRTEGAAKAEASENTTAPNSEDAAEVWKHDDWNDANADKRKPQLPKKPKKDRLISLRRKFERKDKSSNEDIQPEENLERQLSAKNLYKSKEDSSDKMVTRQESKLGKIKEKFRSNFFSAQSSKREGVCAKKTDDLRQSSSNSTATVQRHSSVEIKRVSIEYVAEEAEVENVIPCNWMRCSKQDINDINYSKALGPIAEEDEHSSMEPKSDKSSIERDELKLLSSWNCASDEKEKSSEPLISPLDTVSPPNLDKFDISRKPISNIAKKTYDNRTLSELFRDLIKVETQEQQSRDGKGQLNTNSILDTFLRESLEEHAAAICSDLRLKQKVNQTTSNAAKVVQPEIAKEIEVVVREPETEKAVELSTGKEPTDKEPTDKEPTDREPTDKEPTDKEFSIDDDEAITAMVGPQSSAHEEIVFQEEPIMEIEIPLKEAMSLEMTEDRAMTQRNLCFQENLTIETEQCRETIFKSEKYWYTPKTPKKAALEEIVLDNVSGIALELLVNYCYSGNIEFQEENIARNVLATAALLQLDAIVHECSNYLARKLHPSNCVSVINFAQEQNYQRLFDESKDYACRHFTEVCKYNEFYHLTANQLAQILSSDELNLPSEEEVFNCIVAWVQHDRAKRQADLPLLLPQLRLALMQPSFILKNVEPVFADSNTDCHRLVIEALKWHLLPSSDRDLSTTQLSDFSLKPRKSKVQWHHNIGELLAIGYNISEKTITLESYSASLNKWSISKRKRLLPGRKGYGVAVLENLLLVIGGYEDWDGAKALRTVLGLDLQTLNWMTLEPMTECRYGASVVLLNGFVYVMGGGDYYRTGFLRSVERWDSETYTWANIQEMSTKRIFAGSVVLDNMLYIVGGSNEYEYLNSMERYDPYKDEWLIMAPMSEARSECGVAAAHGYIYVVGGFANGARSNTVERYNPISNIWSRVCSLETPRSCCSCAALGNRLLSLGGYDENGISLRSVEEYNINMDQWDPFPALTSRYFSLFVLTVLRKPKLAKFFKYGASSPKMNTLGQLCKCAVKM